MNPVILDAKKEQVNQIANVLSTAKSFVVFEYKTMTALETSALRRELTKAGNKMFVLKNNIITRALEQSGIAVPPESLVGQIAVAFGIEDAFQPIKSVFKFVKEKDKVEFRIGYLEGKVIDTNEIKQIASLPSRDELYSMFLSVLQGPLRKFMYAMKAVGEKK